MSEGTSDRRRVIRWSAAWVPLLLLVAGLAARAGHAAQAEETMAFSHTAHVPSEWTRPSRYGGETARDCRGCHDYSDRSETRPPTDTCSLCHVFGQREFSGSSYLDGRGGEFKHHDHWQALDCRECHTVPSGDVPAIMPVPAFTASDCATCHSQRGVRAGGENVQADLDLRFARFESGELEPVFRHRDHVPADKLTDRATCESCHAYVKDSDQDNLGENQWSPERCADCHTAEFADVLEERPSSAAATFIHGYHLQGSGLDNPVIREQGCAACHEYDTSTGEFGFAERFRQGDAYEGCVSCHNTQTWDEDWTVENHGETSSCEQCHAIGEKSLTTRATMSSNRPRITLNRPRPLGFAMGPHGHPGVTTANAPVDASCAECHLVEVERIPSELEGRPFDHVAHLPASPSEVASDSCTACHADIGTEAIFQQNSQRGQPVEKVLALFDESRCGECHLGDFSAEWPEDPAREVLRFDHRKHVTLESFECTLCHVDVAPDGESFAVRLPDAMGTCSVCHGHDERDPTPHNGLTQAENTLDIGRDEARSCANCHWAGVPARDQPILVERKPVAFVPGTRERHNPREQECGTCHLDGRAQAAADGAVAQLAPGESWRPTAWQATRARSLFGTQKFNAPHGVSANPWQKTAPFFWNESFLETEGTRRLQCIDCHWQTQVYQDYQQQAREQPWVTETSGVREVRQRFGTPEPGLFPGFRGMESVLPTTTSSVKPK